MNSPASKGFTGRSRRRRTKKSVLVLDHVAKATITVGGIGTIVAVLGVFAFLLWVAAPLFMSASVTDEAAHGAAWGKERPLHIAVDENQALGWVMTVEGKVVVFRVDTAQAIATLDPLAGRQLTAASFAIETAEAVFGFADGTIQAGKVHFSSVVTDVQTLPIDVRKELETRPRGAVVTHGNSVAILTPEGQARVSTVEVELGAVTKVGEEPVTLVDEASHGNGRTIAVMLGSGDKARLELISGEEKTDFLTSKSTLEFAAPVTLPLSVRPGAAPAWLGVMATGDVIALFSDGWMQRIATSPGAEPFLAEEGRITSPGSSLTGAGFVLGNNTLVWGDSTGRVSAGFTVLRDQLDHDTGFESKLDERARHVMVIAKELQGSGPVLRSIAASTRNRLVLAGFDDGSLRLFNVTSASRRAMTVIAPGKPIDAVAFTPKMDGVLAAAGGQVIHASMNIGYPEAGFSTLFTRVWYEGYGKPVHAYQSSAGTDDAEPKLDLIPLVFGTIKATVYSMMFGVPLALLAAIFSSEFLRPSTRAVVKPTIELMASLPSVVLGFLAALVFAPFIERIVTSVLALFVTVPLGLLLGAYLWQLLPNHQGLRLAPHRLYFMIVPLAAAVGGAVLIGPVIEDLLFAGDFRAWTAFAPHTTGAYSSPLGGWVLLLLPLGAILSAVLMSRVVTPWLRRRGQTADRAAMAWLELGKFAVGIAVALGVTLAVAGALTAIGFDPRGSLQIWGLNLSPVGTYVQRNSLVVGFIMGFAVIPIIYTIADDALTAVPVHLRSASLGAGATVWQTTMRIVVPTAMSGLFSAVMVGLGRAVGETMIVLMATGNTSILELNIFNGFRTLSANIAVELPEAVKGGTHYRVLFLAALVLFAMTFVVNTIAEAIRQRFRKRAYQL